MAAKTYSGKKPENMKKTVGYFLSYMGRHKRMLFVVAVLVSVSALCNLLGTYMIRPVVNGLADGNVSTLLKGVLTAAGIFATGALAAWGYSQTMVKASQRILFDIRRDLFSHIQTLPLKFFDTNGHGDIMSLFTNDIDTISDALNNSFAMVIQSFIQMVGTLTILYVLNWRLSIIVTACYGIMLWYIRFSGGRSKVYYAKQQNSLGALNSYIEEMISGQKVVKVFNHEEASFQEFCEKNEALRQAGTGAQGYAATMVPVVVSISYINCAIVAVLGGILALQGKADLGSLASYLVFVRQAALPINQFTQQSNFLLAALAGAERVFKVMDLEPEVDEGKVELVRMTDTGRNGSMDSSSKWKYEGIEKEINSVVSERGNAWAWKKPDGELVPLRGDVRFENVDFGYDENRMILKDISLYAKPGQKIAFVGSTGAARMIGIIDYDAGNIKSVEKALHYLGEQTVVSRDPQVLLHADKVILPGVGSFGDAMNNLNKFGLVPVIRQIADQKTPFLGICLGLQLLFESSEETPGVEGLGLLKGKIVKIPPAEGLKIPHMGWNSLHLQNDGRLFQGIPEQTYVYFVHSYYLQAEDPQIVKATTEYGVTIHASVEKDNIFACQFHPEKSSKYGLKILENFAKLGKEA